MHAVNGLGSFEGRVLTHARAEAILPYGSATIDTKLSRLYFVNEPYLHTTHKYIMIISLSPIAFFIKHRSIGNEASINVIAVPFNDSFVLDWNLHAHRRADRDGA